MYHFNYLTIAFTPKARYYYVGKHSTDNLNDGYFGSGKVIKSICRKYPSKTRILEFFNSEEEAYRAEESLVAKAKTKYGKHSLNFANGGLGNRKGSKLSKRHRYRVKLGVKGINLGRKHSEKSILNMSLSKRGEKNPMFGRESAMKGKPAPNRNKAWEFYDELKILWEKEKLSAYLFKKLAISLGYPDCSYRSLILKWQA